MKLGLNKDEVKIVQYDPEWPSEFERVKKSILGVLNVCEDRIEHIGSTAIEGIKAKPIIDILLGVEVLEKIDRDFERALRSIGFYRLQVERQAEVVFAKFADEGFEIKTHFIHAVALNGKLWKNLIFFRDYLNENEAEKKAYENVKMAYLQKSATGINDYTRWKEDFVQRVFLKRDEVGY
ncbi:GrpB family protein [Lysinibacillus sp. 54212]|uniref:GrpB family protein n=1 Tax=Lysinibacillus sp. 54212 TaxID=3119829 RepID=UPI002FCA7A65